MKQLILVFIGGGVGSIGRYLLGKIWNDPSSGIPYGTFAANIVGSLLIGLILGWALKNNALSSNTTLLLATGFCGGFTTFSTFSMDTLSLFELGHNYRALAYMFSSVVLSVLAVWLGILLGKALT